MLISKVVFPEKLQFIVLKMKLMGLVKIFNDLRYRIVELGSNSYHVYYVGTWVRDFKFNFVGIPMFMKIVFRW